MSYAGFSEDARAELPNASAELTQVDYADANTIPMRDDDQEIETMNETTTDLLDDCRVVGAEGNQSAALTPAGDPKEWSASTLGRLAADLLTPKALGRNPRQFEVFCSYADGRRSLLISAQPTLDPKATDGPPLSFDDDLRYLVSTAKRYGLVPVGREQAERLMAHLGFEASIRESGL